MAPGRAISAPCCSRVTRCPCPKRYVDGGISDSLPLYELKEHHHGVPSLLGRK